MKSLLDLVGTLVVLTGIGAVGFHLIEGADWLNSVYMTVITLTTVGYGEVFELSAAGKVFVMLFLASGIGVFFYSVAHLGALVASRPFSAATPTTSTSSCPLDFSGMTCRSSLERAMRRRSRS